MLQVPSVTMKGGSLSSVTSKPLTRPHSSAGRETEQKGELDAAQPDMTASGP